MTSYAPSRASAPPPCLPSERRRGFGQGAGRRFDGLRRGCGCSRGGGFVVSGSGGAGGRGRGRGDFGGSGAVQVLLVEAVGLFRRRQEASGGIDAYANDARGAREVDGGA